MRDDMADKQENSGLKKQIDENLRRVYQQALEEKVPDRFEKLLAQLREKEGGK